MKVDPKNVDSLIAILAQIREALGVGPKPMWSELPGETREIRLGHDRYQKIRRLTPVEFARLWKAALHNRNNFDQLVDKIGLPN